MDHLWQLDHQVFHTINSGLHAPWLNPVFWVLTSTGLGWVEAAGILLVSVIAASLRLSSGGFFNRSIGIFKSWTFPALLTIAIAGFGISDGLKAVIARDRPSNLPDAMVAADEQIFAHSFPSGHSSIAFGLALSLVFLSRRAGKPWLGWIALLWACLVGFSRIYRGVHWPSDIVGGAFAGLAGSAIALLICSAIGWLPKADTGTSPEMSQP